MFRCLLKIAAILAALAAPLGATAQLASDSELLRFHERFQRQSHNSYEHEWLTSLENGVFNLEIDIRNHDPYNGQQNWKVRHSSSGGDSNECGDGDGSFRACLADIRTWHEANPGHYPITIVIDKKDGWENDNARGPSDFDARLSNDLGSENIFRPANLRGNHQTLRAAAGAGAWPPMTSLRGKFIILMTPHEAVWETRGTANDKASDYVAERGDEAFAFVCPRGHRTEIFSRVAGFTSATSQHVVCFNHKEDQIAGDGDYGDGRALRRAGYILRVWSVDSSEKYENAVKNSLANFIAMDNAYQFGDYLGGAPEGGYDYSLLAPIIQALPMNR